MLIGSRCADQIALRPRSTESAEERSLMNALIWVIGIFASALSRRLTQSAKRHMQAGLVTPAASPFSRELLSLTYPPLAIGIL
jgi:hypothetical protein